jgi:hypothetical protein
MVRMATSSASSFPAPHKVIVSYKNGEIAVHPSSVSIEKAKNEHVQWVADGDFDFVVRFDTETPFGSKTFHRQNSASGKARPEAIGTYKYSVEVNGNTLDPDVIVRP